MIVTLHTQMALAGPLYMLVKFVQQAEDDAKKWLMKVEQEKYRELLEEGMMGLIQYRKGFFLYTSFYMYIFYFLVHLFIILLASPCNDYYIGTKISNITVITKKNKCTWILIVFQCFTFYYNMNVSFCHHLDYSLMQ